MQTERSLMRRPILPLLGLLLFSAITPAEDTGKLNIGQAIKETDARQHGVSILPNGKGLPDGRGTAKQGAAIYAAKCSACHGERGEGHEDFPVLVGGRGSLAT